MAKSTACEAWSNGKWQPVSIDEVIATTQRQLLRCIECGGAVRAHREGTTGQVAHFEHRHAHHGCSLGSKFTGVKSAHPQPLV